MAESFFDWVKSMQKLLKKIYSVLRDYENNYGRLNLFKMCKDMNAKNIYIVDDDDDLRAIMASTMEKQGFRVFSYGNPKVALDALSSTSFPPKLIILDYHMDRMTGNDFLNIKKQNPKNGIPECPVVMVSAAPDVVKETVDPLMYSEILVKPLDLSRLIITVRKYLYSFFIVFLH